ncbi:MAG TPA: hypothetical protein PKA87_08150 [Microthrixaceae bacterium]|nr:hypothetical protein [Microthrixaceae bacterium]MCB9376240.1 hypothetical protein [Microthrixaceae bacterium]MCB9402027.1 hypothetical protein [Microthrixaceae bacterium]MCO5306606.1 hypothetical protein [Microthrixaceae bacterium]HMU80433.1 hypothetical protein [Microthrixaceae bacterium]
MKRVTALIAALAVPAILLVGCGGDDSADSGSKSDSSSQSSDSGSSDSGSSDSGSSSSTGNAKVDKFCDDAKALAEKSKKAIADRDTDLAQEAAKDAQALSQQAQDLTSEVIKDPKLATALTDCTKELANVGQG